MVVTSIDVRCLEVQASTARRTKVAAWEAELGRDTGRMVKVVPNRSVLREIWQRIVCRTDRTPVSWCVSVMEVVTKVQLYI